MSGLIAGVVRLRQTRAALRRCYGDDWVRRDSAEMIYGLAGMVVLIWGVMGLAMRHWGMATIEARGLVLLAGLLGGGGLTLLWIWLGVPRVIRWRFGPPPARPCDPAKEAALDEFFRRQR